MIIKYFRQEGRRFPIIHVHINIVFKSLIIIKICEHIFFFHHLKLEIIIHGKQILKLEIFERLSIHSL